MQTNKSSIKTAYKITTLVSNLGEEDFGVFLSEDVGLAVSKEKGWFGGDGRSSEIRIVNIDNNWYEVGKRVDVNTATNVEDSLKQQALSKLTDQERSALGF